MGRVDDEALIRELAAAYPQLAALVDENIEENYGEMLPYLIMGDVVRWLGEHLESDHALCVSILAWMEAKLIEGSDDVRNLIGAGAVENIPAPGEPGSQLREMLGPQLRKMDLWGKRKVRPWWWGWWRR